MLGNAAYCWASQNMFSQDITVPCARQVIRRRFIVLNYFGVNTYRRTNRSVEQTVMYDASVQVMLLGRNPWVAYWSGSLVNVIIAHISNKATRNLRFPVEMHLSYCRVYSKRQLKIG